MSDSARARANPSTQASRKKPVVLITGAAGALAQRVIENLLPRYEVVAVDFREQVYHCSGVQSYCIDINKRRFEDLFRKHDIAGVIHMGRVMSSEEPRNRRYNSNVLGTAKLFKLCEKYRVNRVIILSTFHVYGANAYNPAMLDESAPLKAAELTMDLIDSVELENLAHIYLWRCPTLNVTILRPCNIVGPGIRNTIANLLSARVTPVLTGFSPMMQFIHVDDMADAITLAYRKNRKGIYNVATPDWVGFQDAVSACGCLRMPVPSIPPFLARQLLAMMPGNPLPPYLVNYFKYPVVLDHRHFQQTFGFEAKYSLKEIFRYYRSVKH